jgi:hypothetical protein
MNDEQQRERMNRRVMNTNERWYCSPPEDDPGYDERADLQSEHESDEYHRRIDEPREDTLIEPETVYETITDEELEWREYFRKDTERHWNRGY